MVTEARSPSPEAVGEAIRQLREASGWSREALAAELKIATRQLAALEAGEWHELPNAIFVRGVLKGIARWGNRDPQPWLEVAQACFAESTVRLTPPRNAEGEIVVRRPVWRHPVVRFAAGVIVVGLLLVGYLQWFGVWESDSAMGDGVSLRTPLVTPNSDTAAAVVTVPPPPPTDAVGTPRADPRSETGSDRAADSAPLSRSETEARQGAKTQAELMGGAGEALGGGFPEGAKKSEPDAQSQSASQSPQSVTGLAIRAESGDSWMQVTAANGTKVFDGILRQGNSRTFPVDGAPYALHLGNAQALVIEWNGASLKPPGRGVVRMQVPAQP
uniref:Transcriptional regulator n=1 Tax=uncultured beta proteobacterium TaxID=86027 RepID=H5SGW4_9PROT|nr:transcriptional regulator [uncultured beta proteobacterium]